MNKKLRAVKPFDTLDAYNKIQNYFFDNPTKEFTLNELCSAVKISKTTANRAVKQLIGEHFLKREIIGKLWRISCDKKHWYNTARKIPYHLRLIYESDILLSVHETVPGVRTIILFGSYRKGDDIENSDIDIAAEVVSAADCKIVKLGVIPQFGYRRNVTVNLHVFSRNSIPLNLFANIANGIVLWGFLEVRA